MKKLSVILLFSFFLISCGSTERSVNSSGTTNVLIDMGQRDTSSSSLMSFSPNSVGASSSSLPSTVVSVRVKVTDGSDGELLVDTTVDVMGQSSVQLNINVPNGSNRVFILYAYCSEGVLLYQGSTTSDLNGTGVTLSISMSAVSSSSGYWTHPTGLSDNISPDIYYAYDPLAAMDDNGNSVIVWKADNGYNYQIYMSEYRNGSWTHPTSISDDISPDGQNAFYPQVAMDNSGNAIIVWYQNNGVSPQIYKSEYRGGVWTHPSSLNDHISPAGTAAYYPEVAMDDNGNAIITWYQNDGSDNQIFKSEYRSGTWTHPSGAGDNISPDGQNTVGHQVAMDNNGNAIITWYQRDGSNNQIFKSEYRSGTWTHPTGLSDNISPDGSYAYIPKVAMDNNGSTIITWYQGDISNDNQIFKSEYRSGGWTHPTGLSDNISPDGQDAYDPEAAMDDNGNAIITWYQYNIGESDQQIFKSEYRSGSWTHPTGLSDNISPDAANATYPHVVMNNNGTAVIVWQQYDGIGYSQVFKSEYRSGSWTHPTGLSDNISPPGQAVVAPQLSMDENGNAIIVWYQNDGSVEQIFKSEYR